LVSDARDAERRLGWKLRDVVGIAVMLVWAILHLADLLNEPFTVPPSVDNALLVVLGWWPIGAAADVVRAIARTGATVASDPTTAERDRRRDTEALTNSSA